MALYLGFGLIDWRPDLRSPVVALEGKNSTLECICNKDECKEETSRTYWKFKAQHVNQSDRIKLAKVVTIGGVKTTMIILNVSRFDEGEYSCGINTSKGFDEEKRNLFVLTKGIFHIVEFENEGKDNILTGFNFYYYMIILIWWS